MAREAASIAQIRAQASARTEPTIAQRAASCGLTVDELVAVGEAAPHVNAFFEDRRGAANFGINLSACGTREVISTGEVKHDFNCRDPLAKYKPDLATALKKLE